MTATRAKLLDLRARLGAAVRGSEPWEESYKADQPTFKRLLAEEQALERDVAEHYAGLADYRVSSFIRWDQVMPKLTAAAEVVGPNDPASLEEQRLLVEVVLPHYEELMLIGAAAGEARSAVVGLLPDLTAQLLDSARRDTADLVKGVTDTTRSLIQRTIQSGIARGEDLATITDRVQKIIKNPVRAEMIAQTETVNAYQGGLERFAIESGAITKEWESKIGACPLCAPLDGKVLKIDELFTLPNGNEVSRPAAHTRCRCGIIYGYEETGRP